MAGAWHPALGTSSPALRTTGISEYQPTGEDLPSCRNLHRRACLQPHRVVRPATTPCDGAGHGADRKQGRTATRVKRRGRDPRQDRAGPGGAAGTAPGRLGAHAGHCRRGSGRRSDPVRAEAQPDVHHACFGTVLMARHPRKRLCSAMVRTPTTCRCGNAVVTGRPPSRRQRRGAPRLPPGRVPVGGHQARDWRPHRTGVGQDGPPMDPLAEEPADRDHRRRTRERGFSRFRTRNGQAGPEAPGAADRAGRSGQCFGGRCHSGQPPAALGTPAGRKHAQVVELLCPVVAWHPAEGRVDLQVG